MTTPAHLTPETDITTAFDQLSYRAKCTFGDAIVSRLQDAITQASSDYFYALDNPDFCAAQGMSTEDFHNDLKRLTDMWCRFQPLEE